MTGSLLALQNQIVTINQTSAGTFAGIISNTGTNGITKTGVGTLSLSGANTYGGTTTHNEGTLALVSGGTLGSNSILSMSTPPIFDISQTTSGCTINGLTADCQIELKPLY